MLLIKKFPTVKTVENRQLSEKKKLFSTLNDFFWHLAAESETDLCGASDCQGRALRGGHAILIRAAHLAITASFAIIILELYFEVPQC
jgi:hypothetical protein